MSNFRGWEIVVILALLLLLFGAKRLPDAARGLGRSLRIFKAETKGLRDDDRDDSSDFDSATGRSATDPTPSRSGSVVAPREIEPVEPGLTRPVSERDARER